MDDAAPSTCLTIVTPLAHERNVLHRLLRQAAVRIICCGPGKLGIERLAKRDERAESNGPVILAGLAGALTNRCAVGSAHWIGRVVTDDGKTITPPLISPGVMRDDHLMPRITSTDTSVTQPHEKQSLAERCDADIVDLESVAFATLAEERGWQWGIVRGVSDGPDDALPHGIDEWVDETGNVRIAPILHSLIRRPAQFVTLSHLQRESRDALAGVADRLQEMLAATR